MLNHGYVLTKCQAETNSYHKPRVLPRNSEWWPFFHKGGMYIMHIKLQSIDWLEKVSAG